MRSESYVFVMELHARTLRTVDIRVLDADFKKLVAAAAAFDVFDVVVSLLFVLSDLVVFS